MAGKRSTTAGKTPEMNDYRHGNSRRKNIPPATMAAEGTVPAIKKAQYAYNPHLPPVLRFDSTGKADGLPALLEKATREKLTPDEAKLLADALRREEPWLEWTGKREAKGFAVDPVALHIHERISAQAILKIAARQDVERSLFADPQQSYHDAVQFYQHDIDWANRLILGDSLAVMSSLAKHEDLAGKVQMIYMDPPYGIKFASNFQPEIGKRDVKDKEQDLTREPEMVKAYRDTWNLGIHSYLSYLRDRLVAARELLADTGSIFVQISDENLHRVRALLDEVFGGINFCSLISYKTTGGQAAERLASTSDFLLWYGKDGQQTKYNQVYSPKVVEGEFGRYEWIQFSRGDIRQLGGDETPSSQEGALLVHDNITSQGVSGDSSNPQEWCGATFKLPANSHWKTTPSGLASSPSPIALWPSGSR